LGLGHASATFVVSEAEAAAIRAAFEQCGESAAAVELRRLLPGVTDNAEARECARTIAGWKPLSVTPRSAHGSGWAGGTTPGPFHAIVQRGTGASRPRKHGTAPHQTQVDQRRGQRSLASRCKAPSFTPPTLPAVPCRAPITPLQASMASGFDSFGGHPFFVFYRSCFTSCMPQQHASIMVGCAISMDDHAGCRLRNAEIHRGRAVDRLDRRMRCVDQIFAIIQRQHRRVH
jgi:hypothetical protein